MTNPQLALLQIIPVGRDNAITGRDLAQQLIKAGYIPSTHRDPARVVRALVHNLRAVGVPVCADSNDGFYLPASPQELREYLGRLGHRVKEVVEPFRALKTTYLEWSSYTAGQTSTTPESEPLAHIPEPYRQAYIRRISDTTSQTPNTPSPFTERGQGGEVQPAAEGQGARVEAQTNIPDVPRLIQSILPRMPVKRNWTLDSAATWLQMELVQSLRGKPYYIYTPLAYLNREGWNKCAIAAHIKDWFTSRLRELKSQSSIFAQEEQP